MAKKRPTPAEALIGAFKNPDFADKACLIDAPTGPDGTIGAGKILTYREMDRETAKAAYILKWMGIEPGETISLFLENGLHFFMPWLGAMRIGAIAHPINFLYKPEQVVYALKLCKTNLLVIQEKYLWKDNVSTSLFQAITEHLPGLRIMMMTDGLGQKSKASPATLRSIRAYLYRWDVMMYEAKEHSNITKRKLGDPFQYICTSGTTGMPKAVVQHNGMFWPNVSDLIKIYELTGSDRTLLVNKLFHVNAQVTNFYPMTVLGGTTILWPLSMKTSKDFLSALAEWKITYSSIIPSTLNEALKHPIPGERERNGLRFLVVGADILSPQIHREFMEKTKIWTRPGYGLTETSCWSTGTPMGSIIMHGSIGEPLPHTKVKIVDPNNNWKEVKLGEHGRIIVKGDNVFYEYLDDPEATKKAFAPSEHWGKGWMDTGDTGYREKLRYKGHKTKIHYCMGRASADSWKVRGEFVWGPDIDEYMQTNFLVEQVMSIGINLNGETETVLCVVSKSPVETSDVAKEILDFAENGRKNGKLEKHYKIKGLFFVPKIELGDTGKKSRKKMQELAQKALDNTSSSCVEMFILNLVEVFHKN